MKDNTKMENDLPNEQGEEEIELDRKEFSNLNGKKIIKNYTRIGNKYHDKDTLNRIIIVRLSQVGVPPKQIRKLLINF